MEVSPVSASVVWVTCVLALSWDSNFVDASRRDRECRIKALLNSSIYDNRIPPDFEEDYPTKVTIQIYVLSIGSVTEASMDFSMTISLRQHWHDKRLAWGHRDSSSHSRTKQHANTSGTTTLFTGHHEKPATTSNTDDRGEPPDVRSGDNDGDNAENLMTDGDEAADEDPEVLERFEVGPKLMEEIWVPDLYFVNDKVAKIHDITMANRMLLLYRNGTISTSARISLTLTCNMRLERYPHDQQNCSILLSSYTYSQENVEFQWHETPVIIRKGVSLPRFLVDFLCAERCDLDVEKSSIQGNYTCIRARFSLARQIGYYVAQVYVPSVLIVTLSWVSFWIDVDATPARISLGLLTVLTMTTQSTGEKSSLPRVSYLKAIDVWMSVCLVFVFAALLEFAYVNVQSRVEKRRQESTPRREPRVAFDISDGADDTGTPTMTAAAKRRPADGGSQSPPESLAEGQTEVTVRRRHFLRDLKGIQRARMADKIARVAFPLAFVIFNVVYWVAFAQL